MMRSIGIQLTLMLGLFLSSQALAGVKFESFDEDPGWSSIGEGQGGWSSAFVAARTQAVMLAKPVVDSLAPVPSLRTEIPTLAEASRSIGRSLRGKARCDEFREA